MKKLYAKVRAIVNRPRIMHYVDIFLAAFGVALLFNKQHILDAHGLNALKAIIEACAVTGAKATFEAYRKSLPAAADPTPIQPTTK